MPEIFSTIVVIDLYVYMYINLLHLIPFDFLGVWAGMAWFQRPEPVAGQIDIWHTLQQSFNQCFNQAILQVLAAPNPAACSAQTATFGASWSFFFFPRKEFLQSVGTPQVGTSLKPFCRRRLLWIIMDVWNRWWWGAPPEFLGSPGVGCLRMSKPGCCYFREDG